MASLLALLSALSFGVGDFFGGLAARRGGAPASVVLVAHIVGLALMTIIVTWVGFQVEPADVGFGLASGVAGAIGLVLLYRGLGIGAMGVVAPITALGAAVVPVGFGLLAGERPGAWASLGAGLSLLAIYLVSRSNGAEDPSGAGGTSGIAEALGAGVGFGVFFILLSQTSAESGLGPLVAARGASVALLGVWAVARRSRILPLEAQPRRLAVAAGVFDVAANALFLIATRTGLLSLVAVLSALYPVATILLARVVLSERLTSTQLFGLGVGGVGVTLIALAA